MPVRHALLALLTCLLALPALLVGQTTPINSNLVVIGHYNYCAAATGTDSYGCTLGYPLTSYQVGTRYAFTADVANTGAASINFNTIGAIAIKKAQGGSLIDLVTGDICPGMFAEVEYAGPSAMQLLTPVCNVPSGTGLPDPGTNGLVVRNSATPTTVARSLAGTAPVSVSNPDGVSGNPTISVGDAAADGTTKGLSTYAAADFNSTAGVVSLDYVNGQVASSSTKGFLTAADWMLFNAKVPTTTTLSTTAPLGGGGDLSTKPTLTCNTCTTNAAALTANQLVLGAGGQATVALGTLGDTTKFLRGNAAGAPTWQSINLATDVGTSILPGANGGTNSSFFAVSGPAATLKTYTFPNANAVVLTDQAVVTVSQGGTGLGSGTSGGVPYYASSGSLASSSLLAANAPVLGGGAGASPFTGTRSGTTTTFATTSGTLTSGNVAKFDASGNIIDGGAGGGTGVVNTGTAGRPAYYPATGTTVDDATGLVFATDGSTINGLNERITTVSASKTLGAADGPVIACTAAADVTLTLPAAATTTQSRFLVIKTDTGTGRCIVAPTAGEKLNHTVNGTKSATAQDEAVEVRLESVSNPNWHATAAVAPFGVSSKTTTYQVLPSDFASFKTFAIPSGTFTLTLVASTSQPPNGQFIRVVNYGSGVVTVARSGQTINGAAADLTLPPGSAAAPTGVLVTSDGTQYVAQVHGAGGGNVSTSTSNTWTTGTQDMGAATAFVVPKAPGAAPTAEGDLRYDTTKDALVVGCNQGLTCTSPGVISVQTGGNTNNSSSGSGSDFAHSLSFAFPANFFQDKKVVRLTVFWKMSTGSTAPNLAFKVKMGATTVMATTNVSPGNNVTGLSLSSQFLLMAQGAPGAAVNVWTAPISILTGFGPGQANTVSQPVALATNGSLTVTVVTNWATAGTGTNTILVDSLMIEALN